MNTVNTNKTGHEKHFDLTEEASKRPGGTESTSTARQEENDDINEETNIGNVNDPDRDFAGENRIATSLSDD